MEVLWFCLLVFMLAGYVVLDGYDLGTGLLHLVLARNEAERRQMFAAIGPFWDANEVWLIAGGGTAFFAFPRLYASSFSGFYLPLMIVLWLLIVRGISIELRSHVDSPIWRSLWDVGFAFASGLLILFLGVALGNLIRGVPLNEKGEFFLPLWTNLTLSGETGVIDWFTVLVGLFAVLALGTHGALWVNYKVLGPLKERAWHVARTGVVLTLLYAVVVTPVIFAVQPQARANLESSPWGTLFPIGAIAGLVGALVLIRSHRDLHAFTSYSLFIVAMLSTAAFTLFPFVLATNTGSANGLTVYNANAGYGGLKIGLWWWIPGMLLALAYTVFSHIHFSEKIPQDLSSSGS